MIAYLAIATGMVCLTVLVHYAGILTTLHLLRSRRRAGGSSSLLRQGGAILFMVLCLIATHTIEIWLYAALYLVVGLLPDLETALYFSTASYTTLGYGDIVLGEGWRLISAIEGANGVILFGWSTAFLTTAISQLGSLKHDWL